MIWVENIVDHPKFFEPSDTLFIIIPLFSICNFLRDENLSGIN